MTLLDQYKAATDRPLANGVERALKEGAVKLQNVLVLSRYLSDLDNQTEFLPEAQLFSSKQLVTILRRYTSLTKSREHLDQIHKDLYVAFEEWDAWAGSNEDPEDYHETVAEARKRVLEFFHKRRCHEARSSGQGIKDGDGGQGSR